MSYSPFDYGYVGWPKPMTEEQWKEYYDAVRISEGFDVPRFPNVDVPGLISPVDDLPFCLGKLDEHGSVAMKHYNDENGTDFEIVEFVKLMVEGCNGINYYFTFKAMSSACSYPTTFQAKVFYGVGGKKSVRLCRPISPTVGTQPSSLPTSQVFS